MRPGLKLLLIYTCLFFFACSSIFKTTNTSELWGANGENWYSYSRLPDFSSAGISEPIDQNYFEYELLNILDFGAVGDGVTDSTFAFKLAIARIKKGIIFIPEGKYVIKDKLTIKKSNIVLKGAGEDKTMLVIPYSLTQIFGNSDMGIKERNRYAFTEAFIEVIGKYEGELISHISSNTRRGSFKLAVSDSSLFESGQYIRLTMRPSSGLGIHLHSGLEAGKGTLDEMDNLIDTVVRIVGIEKGFVLLDRPLRTDVRVEWSPKLSTFNPTVSRVGIESLSIVLPNKPKLKHLLEEGFNGIMLKNVTDSWIKNLKITNADNAINVSGARFCELDHLVIDSDRKQLLTGHHALWAESGTQGCIFSDFLINTQFVNDLSVGGGSSWECI